MPRTLVFALGIGLTSGGCATAIRGVDAPVTVLSEPEAAEVRITAVSGADVDVTCLTPCTRKLPRKGTYRVEVTQPGYSPFGYTVRPSVSTGGVVAGNVIPSVSNIAGVAGVVDGRNGSMLSPQPAEVTVSLQPAGEASTAVDKRGRQVLPSDGGVRATDFILSTRPGKASPPATESATE